MSRTLRAYVETDAIVCADILDRAWHAGHPCAPRRIDVACFHAETKGERIIIAETDGVVAGFVSLYEPERFVHHLYVDPPQHSRGIGAALLEQALAIAGGRASLKCQTRNAAAMAFYRRRRWIEDETGEGEFGAWVRMLSPGSTIRADGTAWRLAAV